MLMPCYMCRTQHARGISEPALLRQRGSSSSVGASQEIRRSSSLPYTGGPISAHEIPSMGSLASETLGKLSGRLQDSIPEVSRSPLQTHIGFDAKDDKLTTFCS